MIVLEAKPIRAVLWEDGTPIRGVEYVSQCGAEGWRCFDELGVSMVSTYDFATDQPCMFEEPSLGGALQELIDKSRIVAGFGIYDVDIGLLNSNGIRLERSKCYDLYFEICRALRRDLQGIDLWDLAAANSFFASPPSRDDAAVMWQTGRHREVVQACAYDVAALKHCLDLVMSRGWLNGPWGTVQLRCPATAVADQALNA